MIQQRVGDLLEVQFQGAYYYLVVLTKIVLFGGNVVFMYHGDGSRRSLSDLLAHKRGFNICTDLLLPKREGTVTRLHRFTDPSEFWLTRYAKQCLVRLPTGKAKEWFITRADDPEWPSVARVQKLTPEYRRAMDSGSFSFDLAAERAMARYVPDHDERI